MNEQNNIIGIYKITSPSNKIYIGQSKNITYRFHIYKILHCKNQPKLYNSLIKYGSENHIFEILEECPESYLDELETWWKLFYNSVEDGLNCGYWDKSISKSKEVRLKISKTKKNNTFITKEWANNISNGRKGLKHSEKTKLKIKNGNLGKIVSKESKMKMSLSKLGTKRNKESILKQIIKKKGKKQPLSFFKKISKPIIQYDLNMNPIKEWNSIKEASENLKIDSGTLVACLKGRQKTCKGFKWKYKKLV